MTSIKLITLLTICLICVAGITLCSFAEQNTEKQVKIIIWGGIPGSGGQPTPSELVRNVGKVAALPADGFVFNLTNNGGYFPDAGFLVTPKKFIYEQMTEEVDLYNSLKLGNLKNNFVRLNIGMVPEFIGNDKEWAIILKNAALAAKAAAKCGAKGFVLDTEMYGYGSGISPFAYKGTEGMFYDEYRNYVRKRGREFMAAINSQMPNAKLLFSYATSSAAPPARNPKAPKHYNIMLLVAPFIDGMMDSATPNNEFIDGYEYSYDYKTREQLGPLK